MQTLYKPLLAAIALFLTSLLFSAATLANNNDIEEITTTVMDYFEGIGAADARRLNKAFHPKAYMISPSTADSKKDTLKVWEIPATIKKWSAGKPATEKRRGEILNIHIMDGRLASVSFNSNDQYYDLLTLAKMNGEWKIINKAYIDK